MLTGYKKLCKVSSMVRGPGRSQQVFFFRSDQRVFWFPAKTEDKRSLASKPFDTPTST